MVAENLADKRGLARGRHARRNKNSPDALLSIENIEKKLRFGLSLLELSLLASQLEERAGVNAKERSLSRVHDRFPSADRVASATNSST